MGGGWLASEPIVGVAGIKYQGDADILCYSGERQQSMDCGVGHGGFRGKAAFKLLVNYSQALSATSPGMRRIKLDCEKESRSKLLKQLADKSRGRKSNSALMLDSSRPN